MKNIRMCNEEIENYFNENGTLRIKTKWEKENKTFVCVLRWTFVILFGWIILIGKLFELIVAMFENLDSFLTSVEYGIEKAYFKRKYLKDYIIPTKKEIKQYYQENYEIK